MEVLIVVNGMGILIVVNGTTILIVVNGMAIFMKCDLDINILVVFIPLQPEVINEKIY